MSSHREQEIVARLFPLPNFVLLPHVVKGFHVFEPRYREMTRDALATDRQIALVLLKPEWEVDYEGSPAFHAVGCLANIIESEELADGRFNLTLRAACRILFEEEVPCLKLYRTARGLPVPDPLATESAELRGELEKAVRSRVAPNGPDQEQLNRLFQAPMPLGALCDVVAFVSPLATEIKQALLEELSVERRARRLIDELQTVPEQLHAPRPKRKWPPDFSVN